MTRRDSYNWLDDPFNEKPADHRRLDSTSKTLLGVGCLLVVVLVIIALVLAFITLGALFQTR